MFRFTRPSVSTGFSMQVVVAKNWRSAGGSPSFRTVSGSSQ
jgi:hypothetical protein